MRKKFRKLDPITVALVLMLIASATFVGVQLVGSGGGGNVVPAGVQEPPEDLPVFGGVDIPTFGREEVFIAPISSDSIVTPTTFFDPELPEELMASSLFFFEVGGGKHSQPSQGVSFADANGESVNVVAPLSGRVSAIITDDPVRGTMITIEHANGVQSVLTGVYHPGVNVGDDVAQGAVLGVTGRSVLEPDAGNVVHLEVMQSNEFLNPSDLIGRSPSEF